MRTWRICAGLAALFLAATPVQAQSAFDEARANLAAGELGSVLLIITTGAMSVNMQDADGFTLLHFAAREGSLEAVRALLDQGADPTIRAKDGSTPLALAKDPAIRAMLEAAPSPNASGS